MMSITASCSILQDDGLDFRIRSAALAHDFRQGDRCRQPHQAEFPRLYPQMFVRTGVETDGPCRVRGQIAEVRNPVGANGVRKQGDVCRGSGDDVGVVDAAPIPVDRQRAGVLLDLAVTLFAFEIDLRRDLVGGVDGTPMPTSIQHHSPTAEKFLPCY